MFDRNPNRSKYTYDYAYQPRSGPALLQIASYVNWGVVLVFAVFIGFFVFVLNSGKQAWVTPGVIGLVVVGWIFSLCLHEFAHAATSYLGGDHSDSTISYLSFNPLKYLHPVLSILLPLLFIFLGGIGLPGGAVYLRRDLVRNRLWQSMISLAGPLMNVVVLIIIGAVFVVFKDINVTLASALALLALFQAAAILLNLLPIPGLDGFGAIQPWLSISLQRTLLPFANYGYLILFVLLWEVSAVNTAFFNAIFWMLSTAHIDPLLSELGFSLFQFWRR